MFRILSGRLYESSARSQGLADIVMHMRFFDNWWEYLGPVVRLAPVLMALVAIFMRPMGYHWE
jgi:hypothetical protein